MSNQSKQKKFNVKIDNQTESGVYSNVFTVGHSETEMIVDFGMLMPGTQTIRIGSRIVMSPRAAKQLLMALNQNIAAYESRFGTITAPQPPPAFPGTPKMTQ